MIVEHQDALAAPRRPPPGREAPPERLAERLSLEPSRLVSLQSAFEVPKRQQQAALARLSLAAAERFGRLECREGLGEAAETAQRQRLTAQSRG